MKNDFIKFSFISILIIFVLSFGLDVFASQGIDTEDYTFGVSSSLSTISVGSATSITVEASTYLNWINSITVDMGNGSSYSVSCSQGAECYNEKSIQYSDPGNYTITATMCYVYKSGPTTSCSRGTQDNPPFGECCVTETTQIQVSPDATNGGQSNNDNGLNPLKVDTFGELFDDIVGVLFWVAVVLCPLIIIAGGFMIIFAGLDPEKIVLGKKMILYASVILGIILIIKAMTSFFAPDVTFL